MDICGIFMERRPLLTATGTGKRSTSPAFVVIFCLYHRGLSHRLTLTPALRRPSVRPGHFHANPSIYTTPRSTHRPMVDVECMEALGRHRRRLGRRFQRTCSRSDRRPFRPVPCGVQVDCCMRLGLLRPFVFYNRLAVGQKDRLTGQP